MTSLKHRAIPISEDKENARKPARKAASHATKARNPFSELSENALLPRQNAKTQLAQENFKKVVKTKEVKPRATSTSDEINVKFSRRVTKRPGEKEDEVFVSGDEHFINFLTKNDDFIEKPDRLLPEIKDLRTKSESKKPAQKANLVRKLSSRHKQISVEEFYKNCLYDEEYFRDNYRYNLENEKHYIFRKDLLRKYADVSYRMMVVNWINCAHQTLQLNERTYFAAIRMFDCILIMTKLPCRKYVLVGIVCLWIANKFFDIRYIRAQKLVYACGGKFQKLLLFSTEKEILKLLKFDINFAEPSVFLFYYLKREEAESHQKIRHGALFLLEIFTVLLEFSSLAPSILAAMALYIIFKKYERENAHFVDFINSHLLDRDTFLGKVKEMESCVRRVLDCEVACNEIVDKYSKEENFCVSQDFKAD